MMKVSLQEWHRQHSQNLNGKITTVKNRMSILDLKGETSVLQDVELAELRDLSFNLHSLARAQNSINWQKSRLKWLQEGDSNSKKIHGVMSNRQRHNTINMVAISGVNIEGVQNIREAVFDHFSTHFKAERVRRPSIQGLHFRKLSYGQGRMLTRPFSLEEVKQAVWDCDGFKSPGPDGINFDFIKKNWDILKDDFMTFLTEFHRNGKLSKGINSTFIAMIPKVHSPQRLNDFCPISLVGCMYKVLAKVLANRLRFVIGSIVYDS